MRMRNSALHELLFSVQILCGRLFHPRLSRNAATFPRLRDFSQCGLGQQ
jgi:hypothetical protein